MDIPLKYYAVAPNCLDAVHERVRKEKKELDIKYQALTEFLDDPKNFNAVDSHESGLMFEQRNAMKHYREALDARIKFWEDE